MAILQVDLFRGIVAGMSTQSSSQISIKFVDGTCESYDARDPYFCGERVLPGLTRIVSLVHDHAVAFERIAVSGDEFRAVMYETRTLMHDVAVDLPSDTWTVGTDAAARFLEPLVRVVVVNR